MESAPIVLEAHRVTSATLAAHEDDLSRSTRHRNAGARLRMGPLNELPYSNITSRFGSRLNSEGSSVQVFVSQIELCEVTTTRAGCFPRTKYSCFRCRAPRAGRRIIPSELHTLTKMQEFAAPFNQLSSTLPPSLVSWSDLSK
jgi:hypothetical protein